MHAEEPSKEYDKKPLKARAILQGQHTRPIHSIVWEESEASVGGTAKELITADDGFVVIWDLPM